MTMLETDARPGGGRRTGSPVGSGPVRAVLVQSAHRVHELGAAPPAASYCLPCSGRVHRSLGEILARGAGIRR